MSAARTASSSRAGGATLLVIGAGNIGSHLLPHLARMHRVSRVTIVDRDVFTESNLRSQSISVADVGRPKAEVMARRLRSVNPALQITALHDALENIAPATLRADIWLSCLDSRSGRQIANERVYRLNLPLWIDSGVQSSGLLARVSVYAPGKDAPCLECLWDDSDYRDIAQAYGCDGTPTQPAPTNGISSLGALAAALQALECQAALNAEQPAALAARELVINAETHKYFVTTLRRNPQCRFDHITWQPSSIPIAWRTLADVARATGRPGEQSVLQVHGHAFVRAVTCATCQRHAELALADTRASAASLRCCGCRAHIPLQWDAVCDRLALNDLPHVLGRLSLRSLGLRHGDLVTVRTGGQERHFDVYFKRSASTARRSHHG